MPGKDHPDLPGVLLETLKWPEAEIALRNMSVAVLPLGAAAKQHGPHLPLNNDALIAQWLAEEIRQRVPVLVTPLINASYYPAFKDYPGSVSLRAETARDLLVDTCHSLAAYGPRKFYVINTGISTEKPLSMAKTVLESDNIRFEFLRLPAAYTKLDATRFTQHYGSHADELETSLMLYIAKHVVNMDRAVDDGADGEGPLSRTRGQGIWSQSGVYGQATLASADKGKLVAEALIQSTVRDISLLLRPDDIT